MSKVKVKAIDDDNGDDDENYLPERSIVLDAAFIVAICVFIVCLFAWCF